MSKKLSPPEALQKAVDHCQTQTELARRIGGTVKQQHVSYWIKNGLPAIWVIPVERAVDGVVTRHQLHPVAYPEERVAA